MLLLFGTMKKSIAGSVGIKLCTILIKMTVSTLPRTKSIARFPTAA